jgi:dihydroorotate dehydrogenase electron transfer subunit
MRAGTAEVRGARAGTAEVRGARTEAAGAEHRLTASLEILPGRWLQSWAAPDIAAAARPGQFVYSIGTARPGLLPAALPVAGVDRPRAIIELLVDEHALTGEGALANARVGDPGRFVGPLGIGVPLESRSIHLLVVADIGGLARVRAHVHEAIGIGRRVVLILEARSAAEVLPSSLLPDEVEYVVATRDGSLGHHGDAAELVPDYEAWADHCLAAGSDELVSRLVDLARGRDARLGVARLGRRPGRRSSRAAAGRGRAHEWLHVVLEHGQGCLLGVCLGCVVATRGGLIRACREGPVIGASGLRGADDA